MPAATPRPWRAQPERAPRELAPPRRGAATASTAQATLQPALTGAAERARRQIVHLVTALFLLAMVEGALRKWVAPQLGAYIFFLRDPLLLLAYFIATRHRLWPRHQPWLVATLVMAGLGVLWLLLQGASGGYSPQRAVLGLYGWRAYFLYPPLAFLVAAQFSRADLLRLFKLMLMLAVPVALLVSAQFFSAVNAPINVGIAEDDAFQFRGLTVNAERVRPMGPFASGAGQQQFAAVTAALLLAFFVSPKRLPQPGLTLLLISGGAVLTCLALSGSRGTVLQAGLAVVVAMAVALIARGGALKGRALAWPAALGMAALLLYPVLFPEGYSAFTERWVAADKAESRTFEDTGVFGRAFYGLVDFLHLVDDVPVLGTGLGFGGNAAITLRATVDGVPPPYAESDFARHMVDLGPIFGGAFILFRLGLLAWVTQLALRATRRHGDPLPMLLWSYVAYVLAMGQLTGQGTINFFGWLMTGALIAACRRPTPPLNRRVT